MPPSPLTPRPRLLFLAAGVIALEGLAALVYAALAAVRIDLGRVVVGAGLAVLLLGYGVALLAVARGVLAGRRWSRGPAVATQVLQFLLGTSFSSGATRSVGLALCATAVVAVAGLVTPSATAVFLGQNGRDDLDDSAASG